MPTDAREIAKQVKTSNIAAARETSVNMRSFPATGSSITGEAGDQLGRTERKSLYIVDKAVRGLESIRPLIAPNSGYDQER